MLGRLFRKMLHIIWYRRCFTLIRWTHYRNWDVSLNRSYFCSKYSQRYSLFVISLQKHCYVAFLEMLESMGPLGDQLIESMRKRLEAHKWPLTSNPLPKSSQPLLNKDSSLWQISNVRLFLHTILANKHVYQWHCLWGDRWWPMTTGWPSETLSLHHPFFSINKYTIFITKSTWCVDCVNANVQYWTRSNKPWSAP